MKKRISLLTILFLVLSFFLGFFGDLLLLSLIILLHEMGHLFFLRHYKRKIEEIKVYPFGITILAEDSKNVPLKEEFFVYFGGILVNLFLMLLSYLFLPGSRFFYLNLLVTLFNTLPIIPLDGGRLLEIILNNFSSYYNSKRIVSILSIVEIVVISLFSIFFLKSILVFALFLSFLWINVNILKEKEAILERFILIKSLYPNDKLKTKNIQMQKKIFHSFYKGKKNILRLKTKVVEEIELIKQYFKREK